MQNRKSRPERIGPTNILDLTSKSKSGKCNICGCEIAHFGLCDKCYDNYESEQLEKDKADRRQIILDTRAKIITSRFQDAAVSDFALNKELIETCREWITELKDGLWIYGAVGTGKTHLACGLLSKLINQGHLDTMFADCPAAMEDMRPGRDGSVDDYKNASILCLDDLGKERIVWTGDGVPFVVEKIYSIINYRYNRALPTIFTSNKTLDELELHYREPAIPSRLNEMSKGRRINLTGMDRRLK